MIMNYKVIDFDVRLVDCEIYFFVDGKKCESYNFSRDELISYKLGCGWVILNNKRDEINILNNKIEKIKNSYPECFI